VKSSAAREGALDRFGERFCGRGVLERLDDHAVRLPLRTDRVLERIGAVPFDDDESSAVTPRIDDVGTSNARPAPSRTRNRSGSIVSRTRRATT
jgi:hypothetical protein